MHVNTFLAAYIKPCNPYDKSDWNKCMLRAVEDIRPYLPDGIPEMRIPRLEPLLVTSAVLDSGNFLAAFENVYVYGLTKFRLRELNFDYERNQGTLAVDFDQVDGTGDYRVKGRVLILDVNGSGKSNITFCE